MKITRFEDIEAWKEARILVNMIYQFTRKLDFSRDFRLSSQIQPAAVSIMSNVAEGLDRKSKKILSVF